MNEIIRRTIRQGGTLRAPFMHLSFLALSTSPKWKLTDWGLIDVESFRVLDSVVEPLG